MEGFTQVFIFLESKKKEENKYSLPAKVLTLLTRRRLILDLKTRLRRPGPGGYESSSKKCRDCC